jgi:hypothetical protein
VPEWRRGRREVMEDALHELVKGLAEDKEVTEMALGLERISVADTSGAGAAEERDGIPPKDEEVEGLLGMINSS